MKTIDIQRLHELFVYDPIIGIITNRINRGRRAGSGAHAGSLRPDGYRTISIDGKRCLSHRIAWALHFGCWPTGHIDHINGDPSDNRIANLRLATRSENMCNCGKYSNNTSGYKGVFRDRRGKFQARIMVNGRYKYLGYFHSPEDAAAAYREAAAQYHGDFANFG